MRQERDHSGGESAAVRTKRVKKKWLVLTLAAAMGAAPLATGVSIGQASAASASPAYHAIQQSFKINGGSSTISVLNLEGTTYVGLRMLNDSLGLQTGWDQTSHTATVKGNGRTLALNLKTGTTQLNGETIYGLPGLLVNNSTYVPLRFLLERMGYAISYDAAHVIGIEKIQENALQIGTGTIAENDDKRKLSLEVNYPVLSGFANAAVQDKINAFLKSEAESHAAAGKKDLEQAAQDNASYEASSPGQTLPPVSFEGSYYVTYNENNLLSLYVDYYEYTGGAHGGTVRVPYTFDLATGNVLSLKDAAKGNANYVSIINAEIAKQIKARNMELLVPFKTIEPDRPFYLNRNGLVIYFEQYEYTAYAYGMPEFVIPLSAFQ